MKKHALTTSVALALAGVCGWVVPAQQAAAYPSRGGNCAYCHSEDEGLLEVSGYDLVDVVEGEELKVFEVAEGGDATFTLTAVEKGVGRYGIILNRLDLLNEEVQYTPRLYTADPDWSSNRGDHEYLYHYGRYYSTGLTEDLQSYEFDLTLDPAVEPGTYVLQAQLAGGYPSGDLGWTNTQNFALRVVPEPASLALWMTGLVALGYAARRRVLS